jgi:hypothetical protein
VRVLDHARCSASLTCLLFASVLSFPLDAQTSAPVDTATQPTRAVLGRVVDESARGLGGADVRTAGGTRTVTDSTGRFVLREVPAGAIQIIARRVGYDSASVIVPNDGGAGSEPTWVSITLQRPHRLNEIVVEGQAYDRGLWDRGFYHRQKVASGTFFDPDAIEHFGGNGLGSLVRQVPRVDVRYIGNADYAFSSIAGRTCRMNIFIDGLYQRSAMPSPVRGMGGEGAEGIGLKDLVGFREIAAVEVYPRASSVPTQFQRMGPPAGPQGISSSQIPSPSGARSRSPQGENQDAACGAIVIWTKSSVSTVSEPPGPRAQ